MKSKLQNPTKNREKTENKLLAAAAEVFSTRGYDGCNVRQIAEDAGVNVSLINRYFGGKEGLFEAVIGQLIDNCLKQPLFSAKVPEAVIGQLIDQKQNADLGYPPQETLREEIFEYLKFRLRVDIKNDQLNRILISRVATDHVFRDKVMDMLMTGADQNMLARLERLKLVGQIPPDEDIEQVFTAISHFSFSANFLGHAIMVRSRRATLVDFDAFARTYSNGISQKSGE